MNDWLEKLSEHELTFWSNDAYIEKLPFAWFIHNPSFPEYPNANHALHLRDDGRGADAVAREVISFYNRLNLPPIADIDSIAESQGIGSALRRYGVLPTQSSWLLMQQKLDLTSTYIRNTKIPLKIHPFPSQPTSPQAQIWANIAASDEIGTAYEALWHKIMERESQSPNRILFLANWEDLPVACCQLFVFEDWCRIDDVVTLNSHRRLGCATALLQEALFTVKQQNLQLCYLFAEENSLAENLYRKLGFTDWAKNPLCRHIRA